MSEQLAQLEKKGGGGSAPLLHFDLNTPAYYNQNLKMEFNNIGWKTATLQSNLTSNNYHYVLYGDGVKILETATSGVSVSCDVSSYQTLNLTNNNNGNTLYGWFELS